MAKISLEDLRALRAKMKILLEEIFLTLNLQTK